MGTCRYGATGHNDLWCRGRPRSNLSRPFSRDTNKQDRSGRLKQPEQHHPATRSAPPTNYRGAACTAQDQRPSGHFLTTPPGPPAGVVFVYGGYLLLAIGY